jgi:putative tricarboxylic transport membrane protein
MNDGKPLSQSPAASAWRPSQEVELIVGTPPGGGQDRPARVLMRVMEAARLIDVPVKVTNIAGKGGGKAWDALRARAGDPHVLSISAPPLLSNRILGVSDFDYRELTLVANLYTEYLAFIVRADSGIQSATELLAMLKADPGTIKIALATAVGSTNHMALGQILRHLGADPRKLDLRVFDSAMYAVDDVVAGNAPLGVISAVSAVKALKAGQVRALVVSAPERLAGVFAGAPTWTELGVPCVIGQWRGVLGAPGVGADALAFWTHALGAALAHADWQAELAANSWSGAFMTGDKLRAFMDAEREFCGSMLQALGLVP